MSDRTSPARTSGSRTVVLVPGAWHGAWCWRRVEEGLRSAGVAVTSVSLTGVGERAHLVSPQVGLGTHVDDVVTHLDRSDLADVVLVGHSYAGLVVREAADRVPGRVGEVVLLDAWVGDDGDSLLALAPPWFGDAVAASAAADGFGWLLPPPTADLVGVTDPGDAAWLAANLTPHPYRTFTDATRLTGAVDRIPHRAAVCAEGLGLPFADLAAAVAGVTDPVTIPGGHDAMVVAPRAVTDFVLDATGRP